MQRFLAHFAISINFILIICTTSIQANTLKNATKTIGSYNAGCIKDTQTLPLNGTGYQVMRPSRHRYFGHPDLVDFIQYLGHATDTQQWGTLLIGDLAQIHGGPMPFGHRSHQTGLDVDIWYWLDSPGTTEFLNNEQRESLSAPSFVDEKILQIDTQHWQTEHTEVLKAAAKHPQVERIFVNPAIKLHLCQTLPDKEQHWLRKIRPWWHHADHFHVRLKCPDGEILCQDQATVEPGTGCDASLDEWFKPVTKPVTKKPAPVPLPEECKAILAGD